MREICMIAFDRFDLALLDALQSDGRATHQQLAERVHLSPSQIGRRLSRLESTGVIEGYRVVLSPVALGLGVTVFVGVKLAHHGDTIIEAFREQVLLLEEVQECYAVAGEADYLLRVVVPDLPALSAFMMKRLMRVPGVDSVRSNIVLSAFKREGPLPLGHLRASAKTA
jgi:Lrp/AsnC family leucine-responsive transcriptional regulator